MKKTTLDYLQRKFKDTPEVDFNLYINDEMNKVSWYHKLETPYINTLPEGTILLSKGRGSEDAGTYLVKTPEGLYYIVNEDQTEPILVEDEGSLSYSIDFSDDTHTYTILSFDVDYEDLVVYLNSDFTLQEFGQMTPVTKKDVDQLRSEDQQILS
jgi:hypothetical protein